MRLHIIRHADPDYDNNTITPEGHLEARALAERMSLQGLDRIYCSPMGRAIDTMAYTADSLRMGYGIEAWTREVHLGLEREPWGRLSVVDVPGEVVRAAEPLPTRETWGDGEPFDRNPAVSDWYATVKAESDSFLARHGYERIGGRYASRAPNRERIAVFCHAGLGLAWLAHLLELPLSLVWSGFWPPPSSVTTILFEERSDAWAVPRCIGFGDTSHLYGAGLPVRPRGLLANRD